MKKMKKMARVLTALDEVVNASPLEREALLTAMDIIGTTTPERLNSALLYAEERGVYWPKWAHWALFYAHKDAWQCARNEGAVVEDVLEHPSLRAALLNKRIYSSSRIPPPTSPLSLIIQADAHTMLPLLLQEGVSPHTLLPLTAEQAWFLPGGPSHVPWWVLACMEGRSLCVKHLYEASCTQPVPPGCEAPAGTTWKEWALYALACRPPRQGDDIRPSLKENVKEGDKARWELWERLCVAGANPCALLPLNKSTLLQTRQLSEGSCWTWLAQTVEVSEEKGVRAPQDDDSSLYITTAAHAVFLYEGHNAHSTTLHPLPSQGFKRCMEQVFRIRPPSFPKEGTSSPRAVRPSLPLDGRGDDPLRALYRFKDVHSLHPNELYFREWLQEEAPETLLSQNWKDMVRFIETFTRPDATHLDKILEAQFEERAITPQTFPPAAACVCMHLLSAKVAARLLRGRSSKLDLAQFLTQAHETFTLWVDPRPSPAYDQWLAWSGPLRRVYDDLRSSPDGLSVEKLRCQYESLLLASALPPVAVMGTAPQKNLAPRQRL